MDSRQYKLKELIFFTVIVGLFIHGYCFTNMNFTHDSLMGGEKPRDWLIFFMLSIGRFLFFSYYYLFNIYSSPLFCGLFSLIFFGIGTYFLSVLFRLNKVQSILCSLLVLLSIPYICFNATYILSTPLFALSYSLTCIALYLSTSRKMMIYILGIIFQAVAMGGEDQSIIQFGCVVALIYILSNLIESNSLLLLLKLIIKYAVFFVFAGLTYLAIYKASLYIGGIEPANSYNSLSNIDVNRIISQATNKQFLIDMYAMPVQFFKFYKRGNDFPLGILQANATYIIYGMILVFPIIKFIKKKITIFTAIFFYTIVFLSPFVMNSVYLISNGLTHDLMTLSFYFPFFFVLITMGKNINFTIMKSCTIRKNYLHFLRSLVLLFPFFIIFLSSYLFTTNVYSVKEHQFNYLKQSVNRILVNLESMQTYSPSTSKIVFIGNLDNNNIINGTIKKLPNFSGLNSVQSYSGTISAYIQGILGYKINILNSFYNFDDLMRDQVFLDKHKLSDSDISYLKNSPHFPSRGYVVELKEIFYIILSKN